MTELKEEIKSEPEGDHGDLGDHSFSDGFLWEEYGNDYREKMRDILQDKHNFQMKEAMKKLNKKYNMKVWIKERNDGMYFMEAKFNNKEIAKGICGINSDEVEFYANKDSLVFSSNEKEDVSISREKMSEEWKELFNRMNQYHMISYCRCDEIGKSEKFPMWPDLLELLKAIDSSVETFYHQLETVKTELEADEILLRMKFHLDPTIGDVEKAIKLLKFQHEMGFGNNYSLLSFLS